MKQTLYILTLLLYSIPSFSQEERSKWIIIDTIIVMDDFSPKDMQYGETELCVIKTRRQIAARHFKTTYLGYGVEFNAKKKPYKSGDSETLEIYQNKEDELLSFSLKIDNKGSAIEFENLPNTDTFHISKWTLYHNCLRDSVRSSSSHFNYNDGKIVKEYKREENDIITPTGCNDTLTTYRFTLNGYPHNVPLTIETKEVITFYHGAPNRRHLKKWERNPNSKHKRFAASDTGIWLLYTGTLKLTE